jgi:hypothetical protein
LVMVRVDPHSQVVVNVAWMPRGLVFT